MTGRPVPRSVAVVLACALGLPLASRAHAQQDHGAHGAHHPAAAAADVATIDAILAALYDVISGPAGEARDWDRFRSLFLPEAHLIPTGRAPDGAHRHTVWSVEDYIRGPGPRLEERGFFEREVHRVTERFGDIAQVFSTYESRWLEADPEPFQRGINSIQLLHDGERWWVVNILWEPESDERPIPERYLDG